MFEKLIEMALSGVVGNSTYDLAKSFLFQASDKPSDPTPEPESESIDPDILKMYGSTPEYINRYKVFSITHDFETVLNLIKQPIVHFVVEDIPTTAWHLPVVVVEASVTKEWYVFSKGNLAFEGCGGGLAQTQILFKKLLERKIPFSAWVLERADSDKLSQGCRMWPELKPKCIPILAYKKNEYFDQYVTGIYQKLAKA